MKELGRINPFFMIGRLIILCLIHLLPRQPFYSARFGCRESESFCWG